MCSYMSPSQPEAGIPPLFSLIGRCCPFFNAIYLAGDHVVLAKQVNLWSQTTCVIALRDVCRMMRDVLVRKNDRGYLNPFATPSYSPSLQSQAGIISSSDVAARAQKYSLLACTLRRCVAHIIPSTHTACARLSHCC
jgi:hypothetical protein